MAVARATAIFYVFFMTYILKLQPVRSPVYRYGLSQPVQALRFRSAALAPDSDWLAADRWLAETFRLAVTPAAMDPLWSEDEQRVAQWAWRVLQLAAQLQRLARIPVFTPGVITRLLPVAPDGWEVEAAIAQVAYFPAADVTRCYEAAAIVLSGYLANPGHFAASEVLYRQLEATLIGPLCRHNPTDDTTLSLLAAATVAKLPWQHLGQGCYQIGWGCHARRLQQGGLETDSMLGIQVSGNKVLTRRWLASAGMPVPEQRLVATEADAALAWRDMAAPLVFKPASGEGGQGVSVGVASEADARQAFRLAATVAGEVIVERQVAGDTHHLQVVDGELLFVMRRRPAALVADGHHDLAHCLAAENRRRQEEMLWWRLPPLPKDQAASACLARQGYGWHSIPPAGTALYLRDIPSNIDGAQDEDVTRLVHPDNIALACRAARRLGLAMAGVDIISPDIRRPWHENGAVINEVNHAPQLGAGTWYRRYLTSMLRQLWPAGGRIPVEVYIGAAAALAAARQRQAAWTAQGVSCFICCDDFCLDAHGQPLAMTGDAAHRLQALLLERRVQAVLLVSNGHWLAAGLPLDRISRLEVVAEAPCGQPPAEAGYWLALLQAYLPPAKEAQR